MDTRRWAATAGLVATLPLLWALGAESAPPGPRSLPILKGSTVVPAASYAAWRISADERTDGTSEVVGAVTTSGGRNSRVAVAILNEADFAGWRRGYAAAPLYVSGEVRRAVVRARLPRPGVYYVVISNLFSAGTSKTVNGTLDLVWTPGVPSDAAPAASVGRRENYRRDLFSFCAVLVLAGILALWSIQRPPAAEPIPVERKSA